MTTAVLSVLATPALADLMVGGDFVWSYQDNDGATSTAVDADINFKPSMTTDTGLTVSADFNINQDGEDDGDNSMTISNDQFSLDLGDTNSALDAIDDVTDFTYVLGNGSPSADHAAILSISPLAGLTIHLSGAADSISPSRYTPCSCRSSTECLDTNSSIATPIASSIDVATGSIRKF